MKKIFASVGIAALGASTIHAQYAPGLSSIQTSKPWSASLSLRGFYDDNYLTIPGSYTIPGTTTTIRKQASWGMEVAPSIEFNHSVENTLMAASYVYDDRWYEDHSIQDQTHQFNAKLDHEFSERYKLNINESFVIAQEPTVLDQTIISSPLRVPGNNVRNTGNIDFFAELTKLLDAHLGYVNTLTAYQQTQGDVFGDNNPANPGGGPIPSRSAALDEMDQLVIADLRWKIRPETTGVTGYQFEDVRYTSPEYIIYPAPGQTGYRADIRNERDHFGFVGVDQAISQDLNATLRVGAEYVGYVNAHQDEISPYVDANLTYQFTPVSYVQVGAKHVHNSTDVVGGFTAGVTGPGATPVLDAESTVGYVSFSHSVGPLTISVLGQGQWSDYKGGGSLDGKEDTFFIAGLNLAYKINPFLIAEAGYNYNRLLSDLPDRAYVRNQGYIGIRATY